MSGFAKLLILVAFIAAAAVAAVLYGGAKPAESAAAEPTRRVRVAAEALPVGAFLDNARAPLTATPERLVAADAVTEADETMLGAVVIAPVAPGEQVRRANLLRPGQEGFLAAVLRPGLRAVSLAVDAVSGNAGHIFPGDRVDLLLTQKIDSDIAGADSPGRRWASETILRDVRVIAVDQRLGGDLARRASEEPAQTTVARTITLEVAPDGAEAIAVARNLGSISLTLRSLAHEGAPAEPTAQTPTWARDISAVMRATEAEVQVPAPEAPAPALARPVTVLRGGAQEKVSQ